MKYTFLIICLIFNTTVFGQLKVSPGSNSSPFSLSKQPQFNSFSTASNDYFVIKRTEQFEKINTLIVADKNGTIQTNKDIRVDMGMSNNTFGVVDLLVVGDKPVLLVKNHVKAEGKNTLTAKIVDGKGMIATDGITIGGMAFTKMSNAGKWYTCLTPDKKHIAVIGIQPHFKDAPDQINYFILDENLKEISKGQFSFAGYSKEIHVNQFLASDKSDLYMITDEFDKTYTYPVIYKFSAGATPMVIPVILADPDLRNFNYTAKVSADGDLILAGYTQKKKNFTMGDTEATGTYLFNSSKPNEVKIAKMEMTAPNLTARSIVFNGDTFYLVGEQYKEEKETNSAAQLSNKLEDNFNYTHEYLFVTGFGTDGNKKFEMPLSRKKWSSKNFDQDLMLATGIIDNKLAIIFNDQYSKYIDDKYRRYVNLKVPVAVLITNDGLMEAPVQYAKELDITVSSYTLHPQFFVAGDNKITVLSGNAQAIKTVTFNK